MARLLVVLMFVACWNGTQPEPIAPARDVPRREIMTQQLNPPACAMFDVKDPACAAHCPREAPEGWSGCLKWVANLVAAGYTCPTSDPRACTPPVRPASVCPATGCIAVKTRIIQVSVEGNLVRITMGAGANFGVTKAWRAAVVDGDVPVPGGEVTLVRVDRDRTVGTVTLGVQAVQRTPTVRLEP